MGFLPHTEVNSHVTAHRLSTVTIHFCKTAKWQATSLHMSLSGKYSYLPIIKV